MSTLKSTRSVLLLVTLVQSVATFFAVNTVWLHGMVEFEAFLNGKPLPHVTDFFVRISESLAWSEWRSPKIALGVAGTHFFIGFSVIWSFRDRQKVQFRWSVFSQIIWVILFFWILFLAVSTAMPFIPIIQGFTLPGPEPPFFSSGRLVNLAVAVWFILLASAAFLIYRKDQQRNSESSNRLP